MCTDHDNGPLTLGAVLADKQARKEKPKRYWMGTTPTKCDTCNGSYRGIMVDGATVMGPWANMCGKCHKQYGRGLGMGRGQKYVQQPDGKWLKVEG